MEFQREDIEFITKSIVLPCLEESFKMATKLNNDTYELIMKTNDMIVESMGKRLHQLQLENMKNMSFIKAVLFNQRLSNEECYKAYTKEWERLNKDLIDSYINDPKMKDSGDSVNNNEQQNPTDCDHVKVYDNTILTSNPPKRRWKCSKCNETGIEVCGSYQDGNSIQQL